MTLSPPSTKSHVALRLPIASRSLSTQRDTHAHATTSHRRLTIRIGAADTGGGSDRHCGFHSTASSGSPPEKVAAAATLLPAGVAPGSPAPSRPPSVDPERSIVYKWTKYAPLLQPDR